MNTIVGIFLLLIPPAIFAQGALVPGDKGQFIYEDNDIRLVYSAEYRPLLPDLLHYNRLFRDIYEKEFHWKLDEKHLLVLASPMNQIANGFATQFPTLQTVFYGGGADIIDEFSSRSWLYTLLSHETAHLYQMNVNHDYSRTLKKYLGTSSSNNIAAVFPPFTYMQHPNEFLPTFLIEGNATMNESRFGNGGRLYNGAIRSLMLQMARDGLIEPKRLMNDHLEFPYSREKYWIGGYFNLYLAERYGAEKTNRFFNTHAYHMVLPIKVDEPFMNTFGVNYETAIKDFVQSWQPLWQNLKRASDTPTFSSQQHIGLTKDHEEIRFLTTQGKSWPTSHIFNVKSGVWRSHSVKMPFGRLFRDGDQLVSASSETVRNGQIRSGLFGQGYSFNRKYLDRYYYDLVDSNHLWANARTSFFSPQLFIANGGEKARSLGQSASSAILGPDQMAYFFKQEGRTRTLYRDQNAIFSYQGYYGIPVEVEKREGNELTIYFIGPSERGTSLYSWARGEFRRMHPSDAIVDAKLIGPQKALIVELTSSQYEYKIVKLSATNETPYDYHYKWEGEPQNTLLAAIPAPISQVDKNLITPHESHYSSIQQWQFDGIDPYFFFGADTAVGRATFRFSDLLQNHSLALVIDNGSFGEYSTGFKYTNFVNKIYWDALGQYEKRAKVENINPNTDGPPDYKVLDRYDAWMAAAGITYPFYKRPLWESDLLSHFIYEEEQPHIYITDIDQKYTLLTQLLTTRSYQPSLAFYPHEIFKFELANEYIRSAPSWRSPRQIFGGEVAISYDFFRETYLTGSYQDAYTDGPYRIVSLDLEPDDTPYPTSTRVYRNTPYVDTSYFETRKASVELKQAINLSWYFTKFPIALRRFALIAAYNEYYGSQVRHRDPLTLFHETGGGIDFEFLGLHRFPFRIKVLSFKSNATDEVSTSAIFGLHQEF